MDFSQRMGLLPASKVIQSDSIDMDLRNTVWNILSECYWNTFYPDFSGHKILRGSNFEEFSRLLYSKFYKTTLDDLPWGWQTILDQLKKEIISGVWHRTYSLLEFIIENAPNGAEVHEYCINMCNEAFTRENSAYRFVAGKLTEITSPEEIEAIETAISGTSKYAGVTTHLQTSLTLLTDRQNPDYRNSIKESISAVESLAKKLVGDDKATLGQALKILETKHNLHGSLKSAFLTLYGYTSDASGIRHALLDNATAPTKADARFMLICCSAFINFAIDSIED
ncbi:AbiJ-NTD4 domain-containing protein [Pseudomonas sp. Pdm06]|uniref:AbiJ-NTD4 domain-containing protein n=1 Tax=Pseudomonas sp. Pdm06 TaxID=1790044 RepID=UPI00177DDD75|nr:hypothetical protein [Pseudomonas sp. Pdm06]MBD9461633.1 hypothetical protein [Pseudomonas sp. Pdm06]